jgi:hypothetical protein
LGKRLGCDVVRLINNEQAHRVKRVWGPWAYTQGLNHGQYKVLPVHIERILLDSADGGAWTKLLDTLYPLICQKPFVDHNHGPTPKTGRESQGAHCFAETYIQRKYASSHRLKGLETSCDRLDLVWSQIAAKVNVSRSPSDARGGRGETAVTRDEYPALLGTFPPYTKRR